MLKKDRLMATVAVATGASTVLLSMVLNVWAFTEKYPGWFGTSVGVWIPLAVLALT